MNKGGQISQRTRLKLALRGVVQGVGFRPFVHHLATELFLAGWVKNSPQGVFIEVEGPHGDLEKFLLRLEAEKPPLSFIHSLESTWLEAVGHEVFEIRESETAGNKTTLVLPDIATCPACLREIFDPANRRHRYPFTNCTNCGPRFSIIESLPYDRANTSMSGFTLCPQCQTEYDDPRDRRFHAQPNACPACGPRLEFWRGDVRENPTSFLAKEYWPPSAEPGYEALLAAADVIRRGQIVAVKGIGGFHLLVDARNETAVCRLRARKQREEKPFALMFPDLKAVLEVCQVSPLEERLLGSPEAPLVLLERLPRPLPQKGEKCSPLPSDSEAADGSHNSRRNKPLDCYVLSPAEKVRVGARVAQTHFEIAPSVAPNNPNLAVMLPSNPLHHLLMAELGFPVVATSGNLSDEPICTDEYEALERLRTIADVFLVHNRPIVRHVDDSIVRVMLGREMVLRRARGYAPLPIQVRRGPCGMQCVLAVGAHLKNAVALAVGEQVFISQHIGDLETEQANHAFRRGAADLPQLYDVKLEIVAADLHPDYLSTKFALEQLARASPAAGSGRLPAVRPLTELGCSVNPQAGSLRYLGVQHHLAHVLSCIAENEVGLPALGVAWDGTGYGTDGTIWGGEFLRVTDADVERVASLRSFYLPGGDAAVKEPRRAALGLLYELLGDEAFQQSEFNSLAAFSAAERETLKAMLTRGLNSPLCSSVGRLFDAVASLAGLRQQLRFEGQAAMELEFAQAGIKTDEAYDLPLVTRHSLLTLDWSLMVKNILSDVQRNISPAEISAKFHNALTEGIVRVATHGDYRRVALSGGCFQNRYLTERTVRRLREEGFQAYWHQRVPTNDGGIALGQVFAARYGLTLRS